MIDIHKQNSTTNWTVFDCVKLNIASSLDTHNADFIFKQQSLLVKYSQTLADTSYALKVG